ncbi:hypothetical protein [Streptomyces sp. NRRL F-2799]|uniref:hypothetical protein n=1 Tax=Streptomyces sp. NRRL F-2799 TaxID=1463844 RepID=UPI000AE7F4AB|nr:hypothetical protein [Streptomyces sp. NRRL F-2799]
MGHRVGGRTSVDTARRRSGTAAHRGRARQVHNAGDTAHAGEFRKLVVRAELQRQFTSEAASRLFGELTAGTN